MYRQIGGAIALVLALAFFAFALDERQEEQVLSVQREQEMPEMEEAESIKMEEAESTMEESVDWVWGDVISVDIESFQFTVKYLDYESNSEKEIVLFVDEKTVFESVRNLGQIRIQDSVSVDYLSGAGGRNIARLIVVDKMKDR